MKGKSNSKKKNTQQTKPAKKMITEYYLIPQETTVSQLADLLPEYQEKAELWLEMDLLELALTNDTLVFEEAGEDFDSPEDQAYLKANGIQKIYAITYDELDAEETGKIMDILQESFHGRICKEDETL